MAAEAGNSGMVDLGNVAHPIVPPSLAPPGLVAPLRRFLDDFPFETNVFGMTRFPRVSEGEEDPLAPALEAARTVCEQHGLRFHLASDRQIIDDLWSNVAAHMWGCRYGIAFFEERSTRGLSYNLTIEVGGCLMTGRRLALLKDASIASLPSDLVGHIYKSVDLDHTDTVSEAVATWIMDDLGLATKS